MRTENIPGRRRSICSNLRVLKGVMLEDAFGVVEIGETEEGVRLW